MKQILSETVFILATLILSFSSPSASAQVKYDGGMQNVRYSEQDLKIFDRVMDSILPYKDLPSGELMVKTAMQFLGTPYVAYTLEIDPEELTVNLHETDCILFVEMCLGFTLTAKSGTPNFATYCNIVRSLRYKNGIVNGYPSRNHYTTAWILQAEGNGILKEISKDLGGKEFEQQFSYMSSHPQSYRQIRENPALTEEIMATERSLDGKYWYLPKDELDLTSKGIRDGDIICYCYDGNRVPGLDIAHVTIAYHAKDGRLTFIHASSADHEVEINDEPVIPYVRGMKSHSGIRVLRIN
jgi:hypothetical protein